MQIDDVMALVDEYVSASIEDHGYRSGAASAEYLEDTKRKLLAAIAALIAAPAAPQQAEPVAWMAFGGSIVHAVTRNAMDPIEAERFDVPLYLHPPAAEVQRLRDAARAVLQEYSAHGGLRPSSMNPLIIDLHRAMEGKQC